MSIAREIAFYERQGCKISIADAYARMRRITMRLGDYEIVTVCDAPGKALHAMFNELRQTADVCPRCGKAT